MKVDYTHITNHQSSREGARIHLLVLHTTEGSDNPHDMQDLKTLGAVFDGEEASSHLGVNIDGKFGRYVEDSRKAWTVCNFNSVSLNLEQVGFASTSKADWFKHRHRQLHGAAEFLQYGHNHYGVPLRHGQVSGGGVTRDGVVQHKDLGIIGCGHVDCGPGYPIGYVILLAQYFVAWHNGNMKVAKKKGRKINRIRKKYGIKPVPLKK